MHGKKKQLEHLLCTTNFAFVTLEIDECRQQLSELQDQEEIMLHQRLRDK